LHMRQQLEAHDYVGYLDGNDAFLTELYTGANNPVLLELIGNLWNRGRHIKLVGVKNQMAGGAMEPLIRFQRQLIDAVIANDPQAAANVTYRSLDAACGSLAITASINWRWKRISGSIAPPAIWFFTPTSLICRPRFQRFPISYNRTGLLAPVYSSVRNASLPSRYPT